MVTLEPIKEAEDEDVFQKKESTTKDFSSIVERINKLNSMAYDSNGSL